MAAPRDALCASSAVSITLGSSALVNGECKAILANTAGVADLTFANGTAAVNFPLQAGYNPVRATVIDEPTTGTAATGVWALY
jgi:hypothetical protein